MFAQTFEEYRHFKFGFDVVYDFMYNFIIIELVFSILSGIIIDTFGMLRD